ncbi:MAG: UMP kinase, partial [Clostridia bacterium]|nr:UMP kinase [Clostridia bacterium]
GVKTRVLSNVSVPLMCENYNVVNAMRYLSEGYVVLFAGGTGNPYFTTDTGVVLKGIEMHVDLILMAKNVDGIYTADPNKDPTAQRFTEITYQEVLARNLRATDPTAMSLLMDNQIPMLVFKLDDPETIVKGVMGEPVGTVVKSEF